jgi:hypothetical protein
LKLYVYGYLNQVQSSRRLEREAGRNVALMWLLGRLVPDHKTVADFRKDNGPAIRQVCVRFVELCRQMGLLMTASVAIDGSKFKALTVMIIADVNYKIGLLSQGNRLGNTTQRPKSAIDTSLRLHVPDNPATLALGLILAVGWAITIIGIPFAWAHLKLAGISLWPIGMMIVPDNAGPRSY